MTDSALLVAILVVAMLALAGVLVLGVLIVRWYRRHSGDQQAYLRQIADRQDRVARAIHPLVASGPAAENVVTRLGFSESLDPERFAAVSEECALSQLNDTLSRGGDGLVVAVNALRLRPTGVEITVTASKAGQKMLAEGTAKFVRDGSGHRFGELQNARTGRFLGKMKESRRAAVVGRLGAASAAIVGAAHIISGADIAKRLKIVDKKIDLLLAFRRIDQLARLERIYSSGKELCSGPMTREKCWELWRLRAELRELRCAWRREMQHHLSLVEDPKAASWFNRTFTRQKTSDRRVHRQVTEGELQLALVEYSFRLDQTLAVVSGTRPQFELTLADELVELDAVAEEMREKASLISDRYPDLSVAPMATAMDELVREYKGLLPEPGEGGSSGNGGRSVVTG